MLKIILKIFAKTLTNNYALTKIPNGKYQAPNKSVVKNSNGKSHY
jgi:hypothetical protein